MDNISKDDISFLDQFFEDELTEEGLIELDKRLKNPDFEAYYNSRLEEKYKSSFPRLIISYLPMILLLLLFMIGIYLILTKL